MNFEVLAVTFVPLVALGFMIAVTAGAGLWTPERIVGLMLTVAGIGLLTVARFNLGNSFSVTPQAKKLVTSGVYSRIRHPVYVFSALALVGLALYFQRPILLLFLVVVVPMQVARARKEGRMLEDRFGDEYRTWKRSTWF
jgi:protein-S-isoprenylcysteine O-methyltransferase Ste14